MLSHFDILFSPKFITLRDTIPLCPELILLDLCHKTQVPPVQQNLTILLCGTAQLVITESWNDSKPPFVSA